MSKKSITKAILKISNNTILCGHVQGNGFKSPSFKHLNKMSTDQLKFLLKSISEINELPS